MARARVLPCASLGVFLLSLGTASAFDSDIISDITTSSEDERRALEIKAEQFWKPVLAAAEGTKLDEHLALYEEVEATLRALPAENSHVRDLLSESLSRLRQADEQVMLQGLSSSDVATERLATGPTGESAFSFLTGGQNFFSSAIKRFIGGGRYSERLVEHIQRRQADILPALQGVAQATGNVLADCRKASSLGFDVLKYDIYNSNVSKTPQAAKDAANKLVTASGETRHHFMNLVTSAVGSLTKDKQEEHEDPSATVTRSLLVGLHQSLDDVSKSGASELVIKLV